MKPEPTGEIQEITPQELFFSTTDPKGVIKLSNEVFTRLSRYDAEQLRGAPHNIVRHPDMPASIFKLVWDTLEAGKPFAAYMLNLAGDGSEYDVFATITPLPNGGYLSVRAKPMREETFAQIRAVYAKILSHEQNLIAGGMNRRQAAEAALPYANQALAEAGIGSYEDFQNEALPAETAKRETEENTFPHRAGESQLHEMLAAVRKEHETLDAWMKHQDDLVKLGERLAAVVAHVRTDMDTVAAAAHEFTALGEGNPALHTALEPLFVWNRMQGVVGTYLTNLIAKIDALESHIAHTRFRIALSRLHTNMCGVFIAELIDTGYDAKIGVPGLAPGFVTRDVFAEADNETEEQREIRERLESLEMLSTVLTADVEALQEHAQTYRELAGDIAHYLDQVLHAVAIPRQLLQLWQMSAADLNLPELNPSVDATVARSIDHAEVSLERLTAFQQELGNVSDVENYDALSQIVLEIHAKVLVMIG
ncbi:PAS domain-containing protein [Arcanobacterium haemolyticum]